ncbi:MAG: glucose-1-phosphate adenylyltransferase subunit GlgD [Mogibacterium sp.]|nr:glucose-1-phosphate adenylyltransferase subunit GlgD [Mogibacterium sp.]
MKAAGLIFSDSYDVALNEMTKARTLAALPIGGRYRVIDFTLSNMANAGIDNVGVVTTRNYHELMYHIRGGTVWDLDKKRSALTFLPPYAADNQSDMYHTRLEALQTHRRWISRLTEKYIVIVSCTYIGNIDFDKMIRFHEASGARITALYTKNPMFKSGGQRLAKFTIGVNNTLTNVDIVYELQEGDAFGVNCYVMEVADLLKLLDETKREGKNNLVLDVLQPLAQAGEAVAYEAKETMLFMDTPSDYLKSSLKMLDRETLDELYENPARPIITRARDSAPTRYGETAVVENCLIADGVRIEGTVRNSIIFRDVVVKKGAVIENSVVMHDAVVGEGAHLSYSILDSRVVVNDGRFLGGYITHPFYLEEGTVI